MDSELARFLDKWPSYVEETGAWHGGSVPLRIRSYLCGDIPPIVLVTSVRAVVTHNLEVLVVRDASGKVHLTPGGQREPGESLEETLRREVLEETGWTLHEVRLLGFTHFHHLGPMPDRYHYPYPDFVHLIYTGEASEYRNEAREVSGYEMEAHFHSLLQVRARSLSPSQKMFLDAALPTSDSGHEIVKKST